MRTIILAFLLVTIGCAGSGPLKPLTPQEERELAARVMADDICGTRSRGTPCHTRALLWYKKLEKKKRCKEETTK